MNDLALDRSFSLGGFSVFVLVVLAMAAYWYVSSRNRKNGKGK